jgi:plasmid maintenance system antidote protein VapI
MDRRDIEADYYRGLVREITEVFKLQKKGLAEVLNVTEGAVQMWCKEQTRIAKKHHAKIKKLHDALYSVMK